LVRRPVPQRERLEPRHGGVEADTERYPLWRRADEMDEERRGERDHRGRSEVAGDATHAGSGEAKMDQRQRRDDRAQLGK
jgi:hypothetical protein